MREFIKAIEKYLTESRGRVKTWFIRDKISILHDKCAGTIEIFAEEFLIASGLEDVDLLTADVVKNEEGTVEAIVKRHGSRLEEIQKLELEAEAIKSRKDEKEYPKFQNICQELKRRCLISPNLHESGLVPYLEVQKQRMIEAIKFITSFLIKGSKRDKYDRAAIVLNVNHADGQHVILILVDDSINSDDLPIRLIDPELGSFALREGVHTAEFLAMTLKAVGLSDASFDVLCIF
ncbi:MAG: hypothetical protein K2Q34_01980 [Alphaproteobacteria bacterium]|nr:hypothetical protein [Alphaproteobacteria bacterium]